MEHAQAGRVAGGRAAMLEEALALAGAGKLNDRARQRLWALVAEGGIAAETAHALVEIDVAARRTAAKAGKARGTARKAASREAARLKWAGAVPGALRASCDLPLATWAVLGLLIARAGHKDGAWWCEVSLTELQRRLGGAARDTVVGAVARLEDRGLVRVIRERRNARFCEINVYELFHPLAAQAAARGPSRAPRGSGSPDGRNASPAAPGGGRREPSRPQAGIRAQVVRGDYGKARGGLEAGRADGFKSPTGPNSPPHWTHLDQRFLDSTKLQDSDSVDPKTQNKTPPTQSSIQNHIPCSHLQNANRMCQPVQIATTEPERQTDPLSEAKARTLAQSAALELGLLEAQDMDHWRLAEVLLASELTGFDAHAWRKAQVRHGSRAALATVETALITRIRAHTEDPIRSPAAYLGGILRQNPSRCRPEITLARLVATRQNRQKRAVQGTRDQVAKNTP